MPNGNCFLQMFAHWTHAFWIGFEFRLVLFLFVFPWMFVFRLNAESWSTNQNYVKIAVRNLWKKALFLWFTFFACLCDFLHYIRTEKQFPDVEDWNVCVAKIWFDNGRINWTKWFTQNKFTQNINNHEINWNIGLSHVFRQNIHVSRQKQNANFFRHDQRVEHFPLLLLIFFYCFIRIVFVLNYTCLCNA